MIKIICGGEIIGTAIEVNGYITYVKKLFQTDKFATLEQAEAFCEDFNSHSYGEPISAKPVEDCKYYPTRK